MCNVEFNDNIVYETITTAKNDMVKHKKIFLAFTIIANSNIFM